MMPPEYVKVISRQNVQTRHAKSLFEGICCSSHYKDRYMTAHAGLKYVSTALQDIVNAFAELLGA